MLQAQTIDTAITYLYVAPRKEYSTRRGDGSPQRPFSSLEQARQAIRQLRSKSGGRLPGHGVTVRLREGVYELSSAFRLDPSDAGTEEAPLVFTAFPGEKVILSGGRRIPPGKVSPLSKDAALRILSRPSIRNIREIDLAGLGISDYGTRQVTGFSRPYANSAMELFINGRPYHLARYPDNKMILLDTADVVDKGISAKSSYPGKIRFDKTKLALWSHAGDMMVSGNFKYAWATDQLRVASADPKTGIVSFADSHPFGIIGGKEWNQYYFFNILEEIDQPGEYYVDAKKGKLCFYPLAPLRSSDTIVVSMLEDALVSMKGAGHVRWENIVFEAGRGIGIYMENTESDRIEHCTIRNMGVVGVCIGKGGRSERQHRLPAPSDPVVPEEGLSERLGSLHGLLYENTTFNREGGRNNGVIDCKIENTGCGGISIGGGDRFTLVPAGNYIYSCEFTNCGRIDYSYRSPVNIDGVGNKVQHCRFNACPATAIYLHGNNHLIEYNEISEACNFIDDQGAIYMGRDPSEFGNIIRWNFFHDIGHLGMTMAVYFDDGACGSLLYGNVFYKAGSRTVMVGGGSYNHIFNNIFIDSKMAFHLDDRLANWSKKSLSPGGLFEHRLQKVNYRAPPYATAYPGLAAYFANHPETPQHNDIENNVLVNVEMVNNGKKEWGPVHDDNFITADDPGFVDAAHMDFTLKQHSVIFEKLPDFQPIPFSEIGLIKGAVKDTVPQDSLSQVRECRPRQGLPNFFKKLKAGREVTVAWLGGSITQAAGGYREQSTAWLQKTYPGTKISAINAGVGGTGADLAAFRVKSQVLAFHPDLVFVEFAVNDKNTDTARIHETMEGIVRQIWQQDGGTDICFVYTMTAEMAPELAMNRLPAAARAMEDIAQYYHIPSVDMCLEAVALASAGKMVFKGRENEYPGQMVFSADNVHPYPQTGHRLYTEALTRSLRQMDRGTDTAAQIHDPGKALTRNRYEQAQMLPADQMKSTGQWVTVENSKDGAGVLTPRPFPVLLKSGQPGASLIVRFTGTMVGLYDVVGPGSGKWETILDGQPPKSYTRFDKFATYWRPNYLVLTDLPPGEHIVEFRVSGERLDKRKLLGGNVGDLEATPGKYIENACYAAFLLLAGQIHP